MNERSNENYGKLDIRMRPWLNEELKTTFKEVKMPLEK